MPPSYRTIAAPAEDEFIEKKSRFIGYIAPVTTEQEAAAFIESVRTRHREARHNCYAYRLRQNNLARFSDDGEPSGTAGRPILEVLQREDLTDVCVVVTRYFGGIKLGAGGLVFLSEISECLLCFFFRVDRQDVRDKDRFLDFHVLPIELGWRSVRDKHDGSS